MRVPLEWLAELVDLDGDADDVAEVLTTGGLEVEQVDRPSARVAGVVIAEVLEVAAHPDADRLVVVRLDVGGVQRQVVCGASNFDVGHRVPLAAPGARLADGTEVGRREVRGVDSEGMLASPRELGVGDDHAGIWVLDDDAPCGEDLVAWAGLDGAVIELDVTPDRGYALSMRGVARDVAALTGAPLRIPEPPPAPDRPTGVEVVVADPARCARFDARTVAGVDPARPTPTRLQLRLARCGMRPLGAVVDATNLAMLETGHPVHAYDLGEVAGPRLEARLAAPGERLVTLDDVTRELDADDLVIADADGPVGLAGVMGGARTEVGAATGELCLEVASFAQDSVLRTARRHGLRSEAARRFEREVPAATVPDGAARAAELVVTLAGGRVTGHDDVVAGPVEPATVTLRPARARSWLGIDLDGQQQADLLGRLGCRVDGGADGPLQVTPPGWRPDLRREADLFEELVRVHGYDRVPETLPAGGRAGGLQPDQQAVRALRGALAGAGWHEIVPLPFVAVEDLEALGLAAEDRRSRPLPLTNPLSKEESALRTTLLPGLLATVARNVSRDVDDVALFEVGRVFLEPTEADPGADGAGEVLPAEPLMLGLAGCGAFEPARHDRTARPVDLQDVLGALHVALTALGLVPPRPERADDLPGLHPGRAARLRCDGAEVGTAGEVHPDVCARLGVPERTVVAELRVDDLVADGVRPRTAHQPSPRPSVRVDVAVVVDESVGQADVAETIVAAVADDATAELTDLALFDVYRGEPLADGERSLAYHLRLDRADRQLTDDDAGTVIEAVEARVVERLGGRLRR